MLSFSQKVKAGLELIDLYRRHALVRHYISLVLRVAPTRYRWLFRLTLVVSL